LKIVVVSQFLGGAERWIKEFYDNSSQDNEIKIITRFCPDTGMWDELGQSIIELKVSEKRYISIAQFSIKAARLIRNVSPDVVLYCHPVNYLAGLWCNRPSVVYVYDVEEIVNDLLNKRTLHYLARKFLLRQAINKACKVIVLSLLTQEKLQFLFPSFPSTKICITPLGVDSEKFHPEVSGMRVRKKLKLNNSLLILYVGKVAENKNIDITIRALSKVKNEFPSAKLLIVGPYSSKWTLKTYRHLQKLISSLKLGEEVIFTGEVSENDLAQYYAAADIFVHMSTWGEGFGFPCIEAAASGKPVICTEVFRKTGVVTDKTAVIVRDKDVDHLAGAVSNLLSDGGLRKQLGYAGRELALKYSWQEINKKIMGVLKEAAGV